MNDYEFEYENFGEVIWGIEDVENALDCCDYPCTSKNVELLYKLCNTEAFIECMIQAGWEYMYSVIHREKDNLDNFESEDEEELNRVCCICGKQHLTDGYCFENGVAYYCSEECLRHHFTEEEWQEVYNDDAGYWTIWEE